MTSVLGIATASRGWRRVDVGDATVAAETDALGTLARVVCWPPDRMEVLTDVVGEELGRLDREASRFRADSEISRIHDASSSSGGLFYISEGLAEAIGVALAAARFTDGRVDPTVGQALVNLGYDRDFVLMPDDRPARPAASPAPGTAGVALEGRLLRLPAGVLLDLGATAKGLGSDRAALAALQACGRPGGVLVSLGGDIAVGGEPPIGGWPVEVAEGLGLGDASLAQVVRLPAGGMATSSTAVRRWRCSGQTMHHIIDPHTGLPTSGPWRTATVAAATCAEANAASTAALVAGRDAVDWLTATGLPARLVSVDGTIRRVGSWPEADGGVLSVPGRRMGGPLPRVPRGSSPVGSGGSQ